MLFVFLFFPGDTFTAAAVTVSVYCTAFPGDRLSECHQWFEGTGLTAPKQARMLY